MFIIPNLLILAGIAIALRHVRAERRDAESIAPTTRVITPYTGPTYSRFGREIR
jgi:hypothetical protein